MKVEGYNNWDNVLKELDKLNKMQVIIGFFGEKNSRLLTIVRANEYGAHIVPKNGKWLTIPTKAVPDGSDGLPMSARNIPGLFRPKGKNILCINQDGELVTYFYLVKSVDIPSRPFMRTGFMKNKAKYKNMIEQGMMEITQGKITAMQLYDRLGTIAVSDMRDSLVRWKDPKNAPATIERKGSANPLVDTGNMARSITYKIVRRGGLSFE